MQRPSALSGLEPQIFSLKSFYFFLKNLLWESYIFGKQNFLVFWENYIQNSGIFRTRGIFRTVKHLQWNVLQKSLPDALFNPSLKNKTLQENFLHFNIQKFLMFSQKKAVFIFQEMETPQKFPCISGNGKQKP